MKLVLATSNQGKVKEIKKLFNKYEVVAYSDIIAPFEIVEDAATFKGNAMIKSQAVYKALNDTSAWVIADDSGISIDALNGAPGIYSARFAGKSATDSQNVQKVIDSLNEKNLTQSKAFYTACISLTTHKGTFTTHGWMHGDVGIKARGDKGFGYDPIFTPLGYDKTLGELDHEIKQAFSHRARALRGIEHVLNVLSKDVV